MKNNSQLLVVGNWKMNGTLKSLEQLELVDKAFSQSASNSKYKPVFCLPSSLIYAAKQAGYELLELGAQDCHFKPSGAFTGDISADQLKDIGAEWVILGHSERRNYHHETNKQVSEKLTAAWSKGLKTILCIGESLSDYEAGNTLNFLKQQLEESLPDSVELNLLTVAYEPVWAIGSGKIPSLDEISAVHDFIRSFLVQRFGAELGDNVPLLYGGSANGDNAEGILNIAQVNGLLVGGASLKAEDFLKICKV